MSARHIPCGVPVNESERQAIHRLQSKLPDGWILLSNLYCSTSAAYLSDEIDLILIGPPGVTLIEVKHWDLDYVKKNSARVEREAERANEKAKRVAAKLRTASVPGFVAAAMLLTKGGTGMLGGVRFKARGISFFGLSEWREIANADGANRLAPAQVDKAAKVIEPRTNVALSGDLRHFGELINLERADSGEAPFHRIYRGEHSSRRDKVILHLFDLSAASEKQPEIRARREFEVIQRWQKSVYVPSLLDSFQEAEYYPGEIFYFSLVDPAAPKLSERALDVAWSVDNRLRYAREALSALREFHEPAEPENAPLIHRSITPDTLRVRQNGRPLFTGFGFSRIIDVQTISAVSGLAHVNEWIAPEIRAGGLSAADARSDVFSLCKTLLVLFDENSQTARDARAFLAEGCVAEPGQRGNLANIASALERLTLPIDRPTTPLSAPEYWDEDTIVAFKESRYRIINRLGHGGIGQTFKVVELSENNEERFGTYVGKVIRNLQDAQIALRAYRQARQYTTHPNLSPIHEIASEWQPNCFVALMKWVEGIPLSDLSGVLELYGEELSEPSTESMLYRWLDSLCDALWQFHQVGLVHGDVSPRNIILHGGTVVLTDYDTVISVGDSPRSHNALYASESVQQQAPAHASDDLFALSATVFHVLFDREPFVFQTERSKARGLNWDGINDPRWGSLRSFLDRATNPNQSDRFKDARDAQDFIRAVRASENRPNYNLPVIASPPLSPQVVPRLAELLSAYPGARHGNAETRGLDSQFAVETYVTTRLDETLAREVREGAVDLIVLFGNAGDGKTAFLQNLAQSLTGDRPVSQQRLWQRRLTNGRMLKLNLDGSAAYQGRSANDLLDQFLEPFQNGGKRATQAATHALAINSGKMLEWLEDRDSETPFTETLRAVLFGDGSDDVSHANPRFRLIDLNHRSLVGGFDAHGGQVGMQFLDALIDRFLGGQLEADPWLACTRCSAQQRCSAWASVRTFRDAELGARVRTRLADALQATHLRGEIHITARELRAALVFIFFGIHYCQDLHDDPELKPPAYWDRAFAAVGVASDSRQGELLSELAHFDPALESDSILDRHLLQGALQDEAASPRALASARRRAFFEWDESALRALHLPPDVLSLHSAKHLDRFRHVPLMNAQERSTLCHELCLGIARLEDLPEVAFRLPGVPLCVTPRTPTESAFWVLKPWERFVLTAPLPEKIQGLEVLHTYLLLTYQGPGKVEERLAIGLELFHVLLALKDGAQLAGAAQEGVFAHLDLFVQRIAQEDVRELYGWHPEREEFVSRLRLEQRGELQALIREEVAT